MQRLNLARQMEGLTNANHVDRQKDWQKDGWALDRKGKGGRGEKNCTSGWTRQTGWGTKEQRSWQAEKWECESDRLTSPTHRHWEPPFVQSAFACLPWRHRRTSNDNTVTVKLFFCRLLQTLLHGDGVIFFSGNDLVFGIMHIFLMYTYGCHRHHNIIFIWISATRIFLFVDKCFKHECQAHFECALHLVKMLE